MSIYKLIFYLVKLNLKCDSKVLCPKSHQDILKQLLSVLKRLSLLHFSFIQNVSNQYYICLCLCPFHAAPIL